MKQRNRQKADAQTGKAASSQEPELNRGSSELVPCSKQALFREINFAPESSLVLISVNTVTYYTGRIGDVI
jgi:hypothetical protein